MNIIKVFALVLSFGSMFFSCDEASSSGSVVLPSNLEFTVEQSATVPGLVSINATAENANFFRFYFSDSQGYVEQSEGELDHTFKKSGDYVITVQAHATSSDFVSSTQNITIEYPEIIEDIPTTGYSTPTSYDGYSLVWQDEFEGNKVSSDWTFETGNGGNGWGNHELQYYRSENTEVKDGYLIITAKKENFGGYNYTSSRMITKGNQSFQYGRIDIRAVLPHGQGIWPALWMLGDNIGTVGWPACGEIDIMELIGGTGRDNTVYGTIHWQDASTHAMYGGNTTLSSGKFSDQFHVFSLEWDQSSIKWYMDDVLYKEADITPDELSEFHEKFFFIMNVAVGGDWPGSPDDSTSFPQHMVVDYIRVFQKN